MDDLSEFQPFEGATNRTAIVTFQKGRATKYPVPYLYWRRRGKETIKLDDDLDTVLSKVEVKQWQARPIDPAEPQSPWLTARPKALTAIQKAVGQSDYRAYAGSCTWANGVYWMELTGRNVSGQIIARNLNEIGKLEGIPQMEHAIEPGLLYPLLRGRDVGRWCATPSAYLLNVQDAESRQGIDEKVMKDRFTSAYKYLLHFRELLIKRSGFKKYFCKETGQGKKRKLEPFAPFYSLYNIGEYTLSPFKVCWREQSEFFTCSVVGRAEVEGDSKAVIPDHKLMFVPVTSEAEAHYVCALLNSAVTVFLVKSYGIETQTSTHVLEHVRLPRFNAHDKQHARLSKLSQQAHELAAKGNEKSLKKITELEAEIDALASAVWAISDIELRDIQTSLNDLR